VGRIQTKLREVLSAIRVKKAVLITGNDAIRSDNNKNEASGDGISTGLQHTLHAAHLTNGHQLLYRHGH
jgi:hypothetical protein